jgi:hypothetical protein
MQYGRRAYGAHRTMSVQQMAKNIVESIRQNPDRTLAHYGLDEQSELGKAVVAKLASK